MEWVIQFESPFMRAEHRRRYVRGKRADREALFRYRYKSCLDVIWSNAMNPFDWGSNFTVTESEPFADDAEFIPGGTIVAEFK